MEFKLENLLVVQVGLYKVLIQVVTERLKTERRV